HFIPFVYFADVVRRGDEPSGRDRFVEEQALAGADDRGGGDVIAGQDHRIVALIRSMARRRAQSSRVRAGSGAGTLAGSSETGAPWIPARPEIPSPAFGTARSSRSSSTTSAFRTSRRCSTRNGPS